MPIDFTTIIILSVFSILGAFVAAKTKLPPALGLLLVGAVMGPSGLNYLKTGDLTDWLIDIGAVILLFITGLEFDFNKLKTIGAKAFVGALFKVGIVFFLAYHSASWFGFSTDTSLFLAVILSFSSTIVIVKVLEQQHMIARKETPLLLGILIAEDLFAILTLSFITSVKTAAVISVYAIGERLIFSMLILLGLYAFFLSVLPHLIKSMLRVVGDEILIFIDFILCMGFAVLAEALGLSSGIGAFLAGSLVASSPQAKTLQKAVAPFSLIASSLFFLAMGTLVDLKIVPENWKLLALLTVVIIISRIIAVTLVTNIFANFHQEQAVFSSFAMFSVGEFSLLIARNAGGFKLDVDLISISAIIIFISSLIMAASIKRTKEGTLLIKTFLPPVLSQAHGKLQVLSQYLHKVFQEFDTESSHSNQIRRSLGGIVFSSLLIFLVFYLYTRLQIGPSSAVLVRMTFALFMAVFLLHILKCVATVFLAGGRMLRPIHASQDSRVGRRIILYFLLLGVFLVAGLYLPFLIFVLKLPDYSNYVSIGLVLFSVLLIWRVASLIQRATGGSFRSW